MCDLRACKSLAETAVIRYAYHVPSWACRPQRRRPCPLAPGRGIDTIVASGPNAQPILARATLRRLETDELVLLTVAPRYAGYHGAIGRPVLVGDPGDEIRRAVDFACRTQEACFQARCHGVEGQAVERLGGRSSRELLLFGPAQPGGDRVRASDLWPEQQRPSAQGHGRIGGHSYV